MTKLLPKIIAIIGPTASGKTKLAVELAKKFNGEIVSADSRQIYRGMDIGTGKDLQEYNDIPYHLIDIASPKRPIALAKYQQLAYRAINSILKRKKTPIICGGSGLYLSAIIDGLVLPETKPDKQLRQKLNQKTADELFLILESLNSKEARSLNQSDRANPRRLIRRIEMTQSGVNNTENNMQFRAAPRYETRLIGITTDREILKKRIEKRLYSRFKKGMIEEVEKLRQNGVSDKRLIDFGLEYKYITLYLQGKLNEERMKEELLRAIFQFAKRQMTWIRRWEKQGKQIEWVKFG